MPAPTTNGVANGTTHEEEPAVQEPPKPISWAERAGGKPSTAVRSAPAPVEPVQVSRSV